MFAIVFALLMLLSACASAPPTGADAARALIDESATAMGGWAALDAVKSQELITVGGDLEPLQAVEPNGEARTVAARAYARARIRAESGVQELIAAVSADLIGFFL